MFTMMTKIERLNLDENVMHSYFLSDELLANNTTLKYFSFKNNNNNVSSFKDLEKNILENLEKNQSLCELDVTGMDKSFKNKVDAIYAKRALKNENDVSNAKNFSFS